MHIYTYEHVYRQRHTHITTTMHSTYTQVLPTLRAAMLPAAVTIHLRDLGTLDTEGLNENPSEEERQR